MSAPLTTDVKIASERLTLGIRKTIVLLLYSHVFIDLGRVGAPQTSYLFLVHLAATGALSIWLSQIMGGGQVSDKNLFRTVPLYLVLTLIVACLAVSVLAQEATRWLPASAAAGYEIQTPWAIVAGIVVVPLFEELLFRGQIVENLRTIHSTRVAIWVSALLFAATHGNPVVVIMAFCFGLAFAWLTVCTSSIVPSLASHVTLNLSGSLLVPYAVLRWGGIDDVSRPTAHLPSLVLAVSAVLLTVSLAVLFLSRSNWEPRSLGE